MNLVIIEGAGKRETIKKYLGAGFEVFATKGHVRDLPAKSLAVDVNNNFEPKYSIMPDKKQVVKDLKEKAKKADKIYLATDPDREGEAIAWHLANILGIEEDEKVRVVFHEITKSGVTKGMQNVTTIDRQLVNAQQARRILDRLVGYKMSPVLCKKIKSKLSAGRVQSVALKLVVDREKEIRNFKPEEFWHLNAELNKQNDDTNFKALLSTLNGKKIKVLSKDEVDGIMQDIANANYIVKTVKKSVTKSHAPAPFITSTLQQDAFNKLGFSLKKTTSVAQNLYEGVTIKGEGKTALVTYIRTDSTRVSLDAVNAAKGFIANKYGSEYVPAKTNVYKTKSGAQDAHEAIRPVDINKTPASLTGLIAEDQFRLYKLIYERFLASQMTEATFDSVVANIDANGYGFKVSGKTPKFLGYTAVYKAYEEKEDDDKKTSKTKKDVKLPELNEGDNLNLVKMHTEQKFTKPPVRFSEATLNKAMEDKGIGRPATYSATISTLFTRAYVEREGRRLKSTDLGEKVDDMLKRYFENIINVEFTKKMEEDLDVIASQSTDWHKTVADFYKDFEVSLKKAGEDPYQNKIEPEKTDIPCDKCGKMMVIRDGRYGKFLACSGFPECKNIKSLKEPEEVVGKCPKCGKDVLKKKSRKGAIFYGCSGYPECDFISWDIPLEEKCPDCKSYLTKKPHANGALIRCSNKECKYKRQEPKQNKEQ